MAAPVHRDLVLRLTGAGVVAVLAATFGWVGFFAPERLGWPAATPLAVDVMLLALGALPLLWLLAFRRHLRALRLYRNGVPVTMKLHVEVESDSDSTSYFAVVGSDEVNASRGRIAVHAPGCDVADLAAETTARVWLDPVSAKPLVFEVGDRRLWSMDL
jgi:hypothetical protein